MFLSGFIILGLSLFLFFYSVVCIFFYHPPIVLQLPYDFFPSHFQIRSELLQGKSDADENHSCVLLILRPLA